MNLGRTLNTYLIAVAFSEKLSGTATGLSILSIAFTIKWHGLVRFYEGLRRGATCWPGRNFSRYLSYGSSQIDQICIITSTTFLILNFPKCADILL